MPDIVKAVVEMPSVSNLVEDTVVNTFVIGATDFVGDGTDLAEITSPIAGFYNHVFTAPNNNVAAYIGPTVSRAAGACKIKLYDLDGHLDGSPHGGPFAQDSFTLSPAGSTSQLPTEVALCLTLRGIAWDEQNVQGSVQTLPTPQDAQDYGAPATFQGRSRPRQRYSGRLYIGPLWGGAVGATAGGHARPHADIRSLLRQSADRLQAQLAPNGHVWMIWSRRDETVRVVERVEIDDAWDIQRRRGARATVRDATTVFPI